jgi:tetratricopeptide (TPR) repeat protein
VLSLTLLLSSFALPSLPLETTLMPAPLVEAQQQQESHPDQCIQLSQQFLQRDLADKMLPSLTQNPNAYRETTEHYRTRQQSVEATLIYGNCLTRQSQNVLAQQMFNQAAHEAHQFNLPTLEAIAYFELGRQALLANNDYDAAQAQLQKLLQRLRGSPVSNPLLPLHAQLLQTSLNIALHRFDLAQKELAVLVNLLNGTSLPATLEIAILTLSGDYNDTRQQNEMALANYADALRIAIAQNETLLQAQLAEKMSLIFEQKGDLPQALHFSELACDQWQRIGNGEWLAQGLTRLAALNREANDPNLALSLLFNALDIYRNINRPQSLANLNHEIGKTYLKLGNPAAARTYLIAARNSYKLSRDKQGELATLVTLSALHLQQHEPELAIALLESAPMPADLSAPAIPELHYQLSQAYEQKGLYKQALSQFKQFAAASEAASVRNQHQGNEQFRDNYLRVELERNVDSLKHQQQQLAQERTRYLWLTAVTTMLIGFLCFVLLRMNRRQTQSKANVSQLKQQLGQAQFSHLPNQYQLQETLQQLDQRPDLDACEPDDFLTHNARHFIHISLPALRRLCERVGSEQAEQLQQTLTHRLMAMCADNEQLYQLAESRFLLLQPHTPGTSLVGNAESWITRLTEMLIELKLDHRVVMGLVHFPFLTRCPRAIDSHNVVELSLIALAAADQIAEKCQQTSWVELSAIDCQQAAFFNGVFRTRALQAIDKGLVKVNALHGKQLIEWQHIV